MYHSRDIADLRADVRRNCVIFLDLCKEAGLSVLQFLSILNQLPLDVIFHS